MNPLTIINADSLTALRQMPDQSVHCCVTSPPYYGLRDYGIEGQIGLEETPEEYVAKMVAVFHEVKRVLRDDGTCWVNLGDSYGSSKSLLGIPWRIAFALQADGWYLRRDIIWHKPNPMPESAKDRPTTAHEYIFLLTKSERYYYDHEAIKEPVTGQSHPRGDGITPKSNGYATPTGWDTNEGAHGSVHRNGRRDGKNSRIRLSRDPDHLKDAGVKANRQYSAAITGLVSNRNKRSVWTVASAPYKDAHFATYPPDLIKPCILAGVPIKACAKCGAPQERSVELADRVNTRPGNPIKNDDSRRDSEVRSNRYVSTYITTGWKPTCDCNDKTSPGTVLDPFAGSGTTGAVAIELGRHAILIELNPKYIPLIEQRCNITAGLQLA